MISETTISPKTIERDPAFFSGYLNLATHNAFLLIVDASKKLGYAQPTSDTMGGLKKPKKGTGMEKAYTLLKALDDADPKEQATIMGYLMRRMPFLVPMAEGHWRAANGLDKEKPDEMPIDNQVAVFLGIIKELWNYRNCVTHYLSERSEFNMEVLYFLRNSFDASVRNLKEQFGYIPDETAHLIRYDKNNIKANGIRIDRQGFYYSFYDKNSDVLSQTGIIYMTCLFLERRYSQLFLKQIRGFKDSTSRQKQATIDAFSGYSIRLPRTNVVSGDARGSLLLDTFNELVKVPRNLFDHLAENKKKIFRPKFSVEPDEENIGEQTTLLVRRKNRFNFFALNFLDNLEIFDNLRFQILYGRFYYHTYDSEIPRKLHKGLYAFARMKEVVEFKEKLRQEHPDLFKDSKDLPKDYHQPYILDFAPRFPWDEKEIVFTLEEKELSESNVVQKIDANKYKRPKGCQADIVLSMNELPALIFFVLLHRKVSDLKSHTNNRIVKGSIEKWKKGLGKFLKRVSSRELQPISKPLLVNALRNSEATPEQVEAFKKEFSERKELVNIWLENYHLKTTMIPDRIRDYLMNIEPVDLRKKANGILNNMIDESNERIEKLDKKLKFYKTQKAGQQGSRPILTGRLADFIAKDIIYFQKKVVGMKNDGKPNSDQFQAIQVALAKWPYTKDDFLTLVKQFNYFDTNVHPFLSAEIFGASQFTEVYKNYLKARVKFLKAHRTQQTPLIELEFLRISTNNDVREVAKKMLEKHPLPIPRGWFLWESVEFIKKQYPNMKVDLANISNLSTPKLIRFWFERKLEDGNQSFYDFERNYPIFDNWRDERRNPRDKKKKVLLSLGQRETFFKEVKGELKSTEHSEIKKGQTKKSIPDWRKQLKSYVRNESVLKVQTAQDVLLYMMGLELFKESTDGVDLSNFPKLHRFLPEQRAKGEVSSRTSQPLEHKIDEHSMKVLIGDVGTLTITESNVKMKDFGKFKKVAYDRRINGLFPYLVGDGNQAACTLTYLENEFHTYEKRRLDVLKIMLELEETMAESAEHKTVFYDLLNDEIDEAKMSVPGVDFKEYMKILKSDYNMSTTEIKELKTFRNAFSHNQYPEKSSLPSMLIDKDNSIIEQVANFAIEKFRNTIEKIKSDPRNRPF